VRGGSGAVGVTVGVECSSVRYEPDFDSALPAHQRILFNTGDSRFLNGDGGNLGH